MPQHKMPDHSQHGWKKNGSYFYSERISVEEEITQREVREGDVFGDHSQEVEPEKEIAVQVTC